MNPNGCDAYRFDRFEARVRTGFLLREDKRIKIEDLPFQMLLVLLETPGQVVTKEELRDRLWAGKTFGELDSSLHVAAAKLREALGESAGEPRLIETVRRRGYQFIGEVVPVFESPQERAVADLPPVTAPGDTTLDTASPSRSSAILIMIGLGVLLLGMLAMITYRWTHRPLALAHGKVVIGGFINSTGDDSYSGLGHAFRVKIEESPYLSVVTDRDFRRAARQSGPTTLPAELAACTSLSGKILLTGKIASEAQGYQVSASAWRCADGRLLTTQKAHADSRDHILPALDMATNELRRRLGEPDSSLQKFNVPLAQATTASLAALKAFTLGEDKRAQGQEFAAISDYKLAVDLDPQFALAYARLGTIYANAAERSLSSSYFKKAFELRERTTDRERLYIAAHYYSVATGEIQRSIEAFELWRSLYPGDVAPAINLAHEYMTVGLPEKATEAARAAVKLDASSGFTNAILARAYLETGNYAGVKALCDDAPHAQNDVITLHESCYLLGFLQNDTAAMQRELQWAKGNPAESELIDEAAWVAMYGGKMAQGRTLFAQARQMALDHHFAELAATVDLDEAGLEADFGYIREAKQLTLEALSLVPDSPDVQASAALALARAGDVSRSQAEAAKAAAQAPTDTLLNLAEIGSVQAAIALEKHDPAGAIQALEPTRPYDLCAVMGLAPAYYRGLAYLQNREPDKAGKEFHRVIDHRALAPDSPYIALSWLGLTRAATETGDASEAAQASQSASDIWKDADPDFLPSRQLAAFAVPISRR